MYYKAAMNAVIRTGYAMLMSLLLAFTVTVNGFSQQVKPADTTAKTREKGSGELGRIVTAPVRIPLKIIDVPGPANRLNFSAFKFDRNLGIPDPAESVPGLFVQSRYGGQEIRFSARGYGCSPSPAGNGIRILMDGFPATVPDGQAVPEALEYNMIGRIELARGNASPLYGDAPGGVVNFVTDLGFKKSSVAQFNEYGSFGLHKNGIKVAVKTDKYRLLVSYGYLNYNGYRQHNREYRHMLNLAMETTLSPHSKISVLGYFAGGSMRLPGSLTLSEFEQDPLGADPGAVTRDERRLTTGGRLGLRYSNTFGRKLNNELEITAWGTINFSELATIGYRIINRYGVGMSGIYTRKMMLGNRHNELSFGCDLFTQPARTEYYENNLGEKVNLIGQLVKEDNTTRGLWISDKVELVRKKMFLFLTGRFNNTVFTQAQESLPSFKGSAAFNSFSPKLALNYRLTQDISLYTSYAISSDAPAINELENPDPAYLLNRDLKSPQSRNFEMGIKGSLFRDHAHFFRTLVYEATLFSIRLNNEIVPYEQQDVIYCRNAAKSRRRGIELAVRLEVVRELTFGAAYTYSAFSYIAYEAAVMAMVSPRGAYVPVNMDFSGNNSPGIPKNNLELSLAWAHPFGRHLNIFVKPSCRRISQVWADDANTARATGYTLLNGVAGLELKYGKFNAMASGGVNNLLNEVYAGYVNINSAEQRFYEAGAPRNYFVSLNLGYSF